MNGLLRWVFAGLLVFAAVLVFSTTDPSSDYVASHFDASGRADAFMSGGVYRPFMLVFVVGFPLFIVFLLAVLPRRFPRFINIPHRDYWLLPEHREQTFRFLERHALLLGCMLILFCCVVHWQVVLANAQNPPRLANGPFLVALSAFSVAVCVWVLMLTRRFRRVSQ